MRVEEEEEIRHKETARAGAADRTLLVLVTLVVVLAFALLAVVVFRFSAPSPAPTSAPAKDETARAPLVPNVPTMMPADFPLVRGGEVADYSVYPLSDGSITEEEILFTDAAPAEAEAVYRSYFETRGWAITPIPSGDPSEIREFFANKDNLGAKVKAIVVPFNGRTYVQINFTNGKALTLVQ